VRRTPKSPFPSFRFLAGSAANAFTLVELLVVVAVIGILAGGAYEVIQDMHESARVAKLESDVAAINRALNVYRVSGGSLPTSATPQQILDKLKTAAALSRMPGLSGRMIDPRLQADTQTSVASGAERAFWDGANSRFYTATTGTGGVAQFVLSDTLGAANYGTETRVPTLQPSQATTNHWVWDYTDRLAASSGSVSGSVPATTNASTPPPSAPAAVPLTAPILSPGNGSYPISQFKLSVTISNPNPPGTSIIKYSLNGGTAQIYRGQSISISPMDSISAQALTIDPDHYSDSSNASAQYKSTPIQLIVSVSAPGSLTYQQAGGPMSGSTNTAAPTATLTATNLSNIDSSFRSAMQFVWTYDGSDPLTSSTAQSSSSFDATSSSPTVSADVSISRWPSTGSLTVRAALRSTNSNYFTNSDSQSASISRTLTTLTSPIINPGSSYRAADLPISIYTNTGGTYPATTRIYYTTNGSDPGNSSGNPTTGTAYSGAFQLGSSISAAIVEARLYASTTYAAWFNPSAATTANYTSAGGGGEIAGAFVANANINGSYTGSLILSNSQNFNFNSGARILKGNLYVAGTPSITYNGGVVEGRQFLPDGTEVIPATDTRTVVDLNGSVDPSNYKIILNSGSDIAGKIYRRTTTFTMPTVPQPPGPNNNNNLNVNSPLSAPVDPTKYANVNLNNGAGTVTLSPGNFGSISAGSGTTLVLGTAGATTPSVYNFSGLTLNSNSTLQIVGPVILNINQNININNGVVMGNSAHPEWLDLNIYSGNFQINSSAAAYAEVTAPNSTVNLSGTFQGGVIANSLTINGNGVALTLPTQ
jgi:prepilin-type N-terminal cleavage/methylation domain-containing protein